MTAEEIYGAMVETFQRETGITLAGDGDMAVRLYAVAAQIYALYVQADWVNRQCFPQTAVEDYLDLHAQLRGVERREAVAAQGIIRFETDSAAAADLTISAGTICMTAGLVRFETVEDVVIPAGQTQGETLAVAVEPGAVGNVAADTIRAMAVAPVGVSRCTNPEGFSGGVDRENDEELRARVLETFQRMPNGANAAFYQQGAMSFPQVVAATVIPRPRGVGTVDVVISTTAGAPDATLLQQVQDYFEARREIAVDLMVRAPEILSVDVAIQVSVASNHDSDTVLQNVESELRSWFDGRRLGENVLVAQIGALVFGVEGVENYSITVPAADVTVAVDELPWLDSLSLTEMGGSA